MTGAYRGFGKVPERLEAGHVNNVGFYLDSSEQVGEEDKDRFALL